MANLELDGTLVDRLQVGDEGALESLYRKYSSLLYSVALRILGDTAAAEEVLQDTFFQLWRNAGKFDAGRGSLTGWLLVITRSRALSFADRRECPLLRCGRRTSACGSGPRLSISRLLVSWFRTRCWD